MQTIKKLIADTQLQIDNFIRAVRVVWNSFGRWPLWMKVGDEVTIVSWGTPDRSWIGDRLIIREINLPMVYFEDPHMARFPNGQRFTHMALRKRILRVRPKGISRRPISKGAWLTYSFAKI